MNIADCDPTKTLTLYTAASFSRINLKKKIQMVRYFASPRSVLTKMLCVLFVVFWWNPTMVRLVGAVGTFVLGLPKKRKKVRNPGLQHVGDRAETAALTGVPPLKNSKYVITSLRYTVALTLPSRLHCPRYTLPDSFGSRTRS